MTEHTVKIWTEYFSAVVSGQKTVELRNDDRGYEIGDTLILREFTPFERLDSKCLDGHWTGRECRVVVTDTTRGSAWLQPGIVALSIRTQVSIDRMEALEQVAQAASLWIDDDVERNGATNFMKLKLALSKLEALEK